MAYVGNKEKISLGDIGLLTDVAPDKQPKGSLIRANNVCYFNGCVQKAPGTWTWNAAALPAGIVAIHSWNHNLVSKRMIAVTSAGIIYKGQDRQFNTTLASGLGALTPNCVFTEGGTETAGRQKKLFLFTGGASQPRVLAADGATMPAIAHPAADWTGTNFPKCGTVHRNRLWAFSGQISYASDTGDHENFLTNGLFNPVYPGEGGELRGCFVFKGRLFAFKDGGFVYLLIDDAVDDQNWYWSKIASNFGLSAPNAIAEVLDNMYAGNTSGTITDYAASQTLGNVEAADLIQNCMFEAFLRGNASKSGLGEQHMIYYAEKKLLFATYRSAYFTHNDMLIALDFGRTSNVRPAFWIKGTPQCLALFKDVNEIDRPMYGSVDGFVHIMDAEDRTEGTVAYTGEFQTPHLDFSWLDVKLSSAEKQFDFLAVHYGPESEGNLLCDYFIDGKYRETISFPMIQNTHQKLNVLKLGTDRLIQPFEETFRRKLRGTGRTISFRFYNAGLNESFQVPAITVYFRAGGDKATQES